MPQLVEVEVMEMLTSDILVCGKNRVGLKVVKTYWSYLLPQTLLKAGSYRL